MKKTFSFFTVLILLTTATLFAQSGMPTWTLPVAAGTTFRVDLDAQTSFPLRKQYLLSEVTGGGGLVITAAASGTAHMFPELTLTFCNDSFPHPDEDCGKKGMIVDHGNNFFTLYNHLDSASCAAFGIVNGTTVTAGQPLGIARPGGAIGLRKAHFEVLYPNDPNWMYSPLGELVRNIVTVRTRTGSYQYDTQNRVPNFTIGTQYRPLQAGELITVGAAKMAATATLVSGADMEVYPNPLGHGDLLHLNLNLPEAVQLSVKVLNLQGSVVAMPVQNLSAEAGQFQFELDLSAFASGLYFLQVDAGGKRYSRKVVIE